MFVTSGPSAAPGPVIPSDPALPACALLQQDEFRAGVISGVLKQWLGSEAALLKSRATLHRYVAGKRCSFRIALTASRVPEATAERRQLVAKVYAKDHGAHAFEVLQEIRSRGFSEGELQVPEPLAYDPRWKLLLLDYAEGDVLRSLVVNALDPSGRMEQAARWLCAFHQCGATKGRRLTWAGHLETLTSERQALARVYPESDSRLDHLLRRFDAQGAALAGWTEGPTHRDFSPDHLVINGARVTAIDFDEFRQYDPMFDVAHFSAHLQLLALRHVNDVTRFDGLVETFQAAYRAGAADYSETRVRFYHAVACFKLAHILAVVVRPPAWKEATDEFLRKAERIDE